MGFQSEKKIHYVPGKEWRRHEPNLNLLEPMRPPVDTVVISYTLKDPCFSFKDCLREIKWTQKCHMFGSKLPDIRYNFLIGGDASVFECRGWTTRPSISTKYPSPSPDCVYIAFVGRFDDEPPEEAMMDSLRWLLKYGVDNNYLTENYREISFEKSLPPTGTGHGVE